MVAAVQQAHRAGPGRSAPGIAGLLALHLALAATLPCRADTVTEWRAPSVDDTTTLDGQNYSYYYVPRLSELNQLVGYLFHTGLVRKDAPDREAAITRYAAYSCEGTLYVGGEPGAAGAEDINWSRVTALHAGPTIGPPSLVIERGRRAEGTDRPLVLYVPDATIRYQLHQALAVLVSECRPRGDRGR